MIPAQPTVVLSRTARWDWELDRADVNGPVPDMQGESSGGKPMQFRPDAVTVTYTRTGGEDASVVVEVSGPQVRRDGTCGWLARGSCRFLHGAASLPLMPSWLAELVLPQVIVQKVDVTVPDLSAQQGYRPSP